MEEKIQSMLYANTPDEIIDVLRQEYEEKEIVEHIGQSYIALLEKLRKGFKVKEVAKMYDVCEKKIRDAIAEKKLNCLNFGRVIRVTSKQLEEFERNNMHDFRFSRINQVSKIL